MANLTQTDIDELVATVQRYPFMVAAGSTELGALAGPPQVEPDVELKSIQLYETGTESAAEMLVKNGVKITIKTRNIEAAMTLLGGFAKGDNVIAPAKKTTVTMVPITAASGAKTITFTDAYLQPGLSFAPGQNDDPSEATLVYICKPNITTGKPWTYAAA